MKDKKDYIMILLFLVICIFILLKGCNNPLPELKPEQPIISTHDTIFNNDTIIQFKTITEFKYKTIYKIDTITDSISIVDLPFIRTYNDSLVDSNQTIYTDIKVAGKLKEMSLAYKLKYKPSLITNSNTVTIVKTTVEPSKISIFAGLEVGGNESSFNLSPFIKIDINSSSIQYRYEVINKTHSIGAGYRLYNSKK